jgi:hypothetical protein
LLLTMPLPMRKLLRCRHCGETEDVELDAMTGELRRTRPDINWVQLDSVWLACSPHCRDQLAWCELCHVPRTDPAHVRCRNYVPACKEHSATARRAS